MHFSLFHFLQEYLFTEYFPDIGTEIPLAFQHFAVFPENRLSVFIQLRHIAAVDLVKNFFDLVLQAVAENGTESDIKQVAECVGNFHDIPAFAGFQVFLILFFQEVVTQHVFIFVYGSGGLVPVADKKNLVKFFYVLNLVDQHLVVCNLFAHVNRFEPQKNDAESDAASKRDSVYERLLTRPRVAAMENKKPHRSRAVIKKGIFLFYAGYCTTRFLNPVI